ncbi:hypothetical protein QQA43_00840 [Mycolicibacterium vanbaalenii]|uniref:hypothetical protein n=1 Tax=Mycolicibacterium vanbaalenii TaxID=110539 RepID=UPI0028773371|nr:hypothetical protein [Mycolicibacterium vanbaalenii]WND56996.1 hypothetical protein QQA43_00840 [Mycolicibacterium vanbaalenii]
MLERLAHGPYVQTVAGRTASGGEWHIERRTPGLLDALTDVVLKRTRMGGGGGHRKKGDELPAPFEPDTERGKQTAQGRADQLLVAARNSLSTIVRDLCETRGGQPRGLGDAEPADMAIWLAKHVHTIACDEAAGQWWAEIDTLVRAIERAIDRPEPDRFCGPCPTYIEHNRDNCGNLLYSRRNRWVAGHLTPVTEVHCRVCNTTHSIAVLIARLENRADVMRFTSAEILTIMQALETPVPERTWRRWRKEGRVKIRGYKRPDNADGTRGSVMLHRRGDDDEPVYRLVEVRNEYRRSIKHGDARVRQITPV